MLRTVDKTRKKRRSGLIILSIVILILMIVGILTLLALNDPGRNQTPAAADTKTVLTKLGSAAFSKEPAQITQQELNGLLSSRYPSMPPQCVIHSDSTVEIYVPVNYKGIRVGLTANCAVEFDSSRQVLSFQPDTISIGRLSVPPAFALHFAKDKLPEGITTQNGIVYAQLSALTGDDLSSITGVRITAIKIFQGNIMVGVAGDFDQFKEFVVQTLPDLLKSIK